MRYDSRAGAAMLRPLFVPERDLLKDADMTTRVYDPESGYFVSEKHQYVASIVNDYNPELSVVWIPPERRETPDDHKHPFAIVHTKANGAQYLVMLIAEDEMDQRVIARLFEADLSKNDVRGHVEANNRAAKLMEAYENAAHMEEMADFHKSLIQSPLHTYKHKGKVYS